MQKWAVIAAALMVGMIGGCSVANNPPPPVASSSPSLTHPTTQPVVDVRRILLGSSILAIQSTNDVDTARTAYGRGAAIDPDNLVLNKTYVERLIELETPELAFDAAKKVLTVEPNDGLSRGVLAFVEARSGRMSNALTDIARAVKVAANDPFVQDTAGHLLGWYDRATPAPVMPEPVQADVRRVHVALDNEIVFGAAYQDASLYYLDQRRQMAQAGVSTIDGPIMVDGPVGGTAAGPVPFASTPSEANDADAAEDIAPIAYAVEPAFIEYSGLVFVTGYFNQLEHHPHRDHHPGRRHDAEITFRDHFFGQGYRSVAVGGGRGVTAQAYLRDRFPAAFSLAGRNNFVAAQEGRGNHPVQNRVPAGVIPGSPGYQSISAGGIRLGGAVGTPSPGINLGSFGAIGMPPGFLAAPTPAPAAAPSAGIPTNATGRGNVVRSSSAGRGGSPPNGRGN